MARQLILTPVEEKQIETVWNKIVKIYPQLNDDNFPLDFTLEDFIDEVRLGMQTDI